MSVEQRTQKFDLATGQEFVLRERQSAAHDPAAVKKRYGLGEGDRLAQWQQINPLRVAQKMSYIAKRMLTKDKALVRVVNIRNGDGQWQLMRLDAANRTEKHLLMRMVARFVEAAGADALIEVSEKWILPEVLAGSLRDLDDIANVAGRKEALQVTVATREGLLQSEVTGFTRGPFGGIKLGDTHLSRDDRAYYYLEPVFEVWRRQGYRSTPEGSRMPRAWEPDPLDICFCGGPKRFAECCSSFLRGTAKQQDNDDLFRKALEARDFERAEVFARATLAQYVIWVKQHTAMVMNTASDLHHQLSEIDAPALTAYIACLNDALGANGNSASFLSQLRRIGSAVGVPDLSARVVALAAWWLFRSGDYAAAAEELQTLGDIEQLKDTSALILASRLLDLSEGETRKILTRAVSAGLTAEERWTAELELARHLDESRDLAAALRTVECIVSGCRGATNARDMLSHARFLRTLITESEEDFAAAIEKAQASQDNYDLAIMLIEKGEYERAEEILSPLQSEEPVAQLLTVDARMRANRSSAAREMLLRVKPESVTGRLHYAYAVTCSLVSLACDDQELRRVSIKTLGEIPAAGTRLARDVKNLLAALESGEPAENTRGIFERVRQLIGRRPPTSRG